MSVTLLGLLSARALSRTQHVVMDSKSKTTHSGDEPPINLAEYLFEGIPYRHII